jgi:type 1 fimbria pilin
MKYSKKIMLGAVLWAVANGVYASAANLRVAGTLLPTSCIPSFPAGGVYDLGTGAIKGFSADELNTLPAKSFSYRIDCDAAIPVSYRVIDNRASTITGAGNRAWAYGLGRQGTANLGYVSVLIAGQPRADGRAVALLRSDNAGGSWAGAALGTAVIPARSFSFTSTGSSAPEAFRRYEGAFTFQPYLRSLRGLNIDEEIVLDGSMTMEVTYL